MTALDTAARLSRQSRERTDSRDAEIARKRARIVAALPPEMVTGLEQFRDIFGPLRIGNVRVRHGEEFVPLEAKNRP